MAAIVPDLPSSSSLCTPDSLLIKPPAPLFSLPFSSSLPLFFFIYSFQKVVADAATRPYRFAADTIFSPPWLPVIIDPVRFLDWEKPKAHCFANYRFPSHSSIREERRNFPRRSLFTTSWLFGVIIGPDNRPLRYDRLRLIRDA